MSLSFKLSDSGPRRLGKSISERIPQLGWNSNWQHCVYIIDIISLCCSLSIFSHLHHPHTHHHQHFFSTPASSHILFGARLGGSQFFPLFLHSEPAAEARPTWMRSITDTNKSKQGPDHRSTRIRVDSESTTTILKLQFSGVIS